MHLVQRFLFFATLAILLAAGSASPALAQQRIFRHPQPGDVYKEYLRLMDYFGKEFRVTWPESPVDRAIAELPNSVLDLKVDDLQGATRAELIVDFWGGHAGTVGKQIRFNGHAWLDVPDLTTVPESPECYTTMRNVTIDIPLDHLVEGTNYFEGTNTGQTCNNFQWGLWGWYGAILRVYYGPSKPHATGTIATWKSGDSLPENPTIAASVSGSVSRVDFLAWYDGYDEDGDGFYQDYHHSYHRRLDEDDLPIRDHLGSATSAPWQVIWNTGWLPDQAPGSVKLIARICDANGYWYVTPEVKNLTMLRSGYSIRMYHPTDVPTEWQTRASNLMTCHIPIPASDDLAEATAAQWHMRTWNGRDGGELDPNDYYYTRINDWTTPQYGVTYFYSYDILNIPLSAIVNGSNTISYFATSMGHGIELLWPGPSLIVRFGIPLSVQLAAFTAVSESYTSVKIAWKTLSETNNFGFEVQRAYETPTDFVTIPGSFQAGKGTTLETTDYSYTDTQAGKPVRYYRLKQVDLNGKITYNEPVRVDVLTDVKPEAVPAAYALDQAYPNPFNPSTTIAFALPKAGAVRLRVLNQLGQEVRTLFDGVKEAGYHQVTLDAQGLASGVYFYRIEASGFTATRKVVLIR